MKLLLGYVEIIQLILGVTDYNESPANNLVCDELHSGGSLMQTRNNSGLMTVP